MTFKVLNSLAPSVCLTGSCLGWGAVRVSQQGWPNPQGTGFQLQWGLGPRSPFRDGPGFACKVPILGAPQVNPTRVETPSLPRSFSCSWSTQRRLP